KETILEVGLIVIGGYGTSKYAGMLSKYTGGLGGSVRPAKVTGDAVGTSTKVVDVATDSAGGNQGLSYQLIINEGGKNPNWEAHNIVNYAKYKEVLRTAEAANPLVESLRTTGKLPSNYITKAEAMKSGWKPGKALGNFVDDAQIGGDKLLNKDSIAPNALGREWYEADVGLSNSMSRAKQAGTRLLYSNDGLLYITYDHYKTAYSIGIWKYIYGGMI
ncbi:MAG: hypothetical protein IKJ73_04220, partial [Lachnospiraceae bacterium]|nr:hypothetical protein [Lachnospiraceae bacterium]